MRRARDYRGWARESLKGNWGTAILVMLISYAIIGISSVSVVGPLIVSGPLLVGVCFVMSKLTRRQNAEIGDMFKPFSVSFVNSFITYLLKTLYLVLWSLLIIPGIIKSFSYAMTEYIVADDPKMSGNDAITLSRKMMDGKKWKLFCLQLSFLGWAILASITVIGIVFLMPYMEAAKAAFYEDAKADFLSKSSEYGYNQPQG